VAFVFCIRKKSQECLVEAYGGEGKAIAKKKGVVKRADRTRG